MTFSATNAASPVERRPGGQHRELVSAHTGHGVTAPHRTRQPPGDLLQQLVARRMPEAVVDPLEPVQIEQEDRQLPFGLPPFSQRQADRLLEEELVGQPGQCVVEGLVLELLDEAGVLERTRAHPRRASSSLASCGAERVEATCSPTPPAIAPGSVLPGQPAPEFALAGGSRRPGPAAEEQLPGRRGDGLLDVVRFHRGMGVDAGSEGRRAVPDPSGPGATRPARFGGTPIGRARRAPPTSTPNRPTPPRRPMATVVAQTRRRKPNPLSRDPQNDWPSTPPSLPTRNGVDDQEDGGAEDDRGECPRGRHPRSHREAGRADRQPDGRDDHSGVEGDTDRGRRLAQPASGTAMAKASTTARGGRSSTMATRKASSSEEGLGSSWRGMKSG